MIKSKKKVLSKSKSKRPRISSVKHNYDSFIKTQKSLKRNKHLKTKKTQLKEYKLVNINKKIKTDPVKLINYLKTKFEDEKFDDKLLQNINFFSKEKMGKSGAMIGFVNYENGVKIIKLFKNNKNPIKNTNNCIYLNHDFNELIITYLLNNMNLILNKKDLEEYKRKKFDELIIKNYLCKISKKNTIIINELVGIKLKRNITQISNY